MVNFTSLMMYFGHRVNTCAEGVLLLVVLAFKTEKERLNFFYSYKTISFEIETQKLRNVPLIKYTESYILNQVQLGRMVYLLISQ